jgi:hypothetical protein
LILDQMVAFDLRLAFVDATIRSVSIGRPTAAQRGQYSPGERSI